MLHNATTLEMIECPYILFFVPLCSFGVDTQASKKATPQTHLASRDSNFSHPAFSSSSVVITDRSGAGLAQCEEDSKALAPRNLQGSWLGTEASPGSGSSIDDDEDYRAAATASIFKPRYSSAAFKSLSDYSPSQCDGAVIHTSTCYSHLFLVQNAITQVRSIY